MRPIIAVSAVTVALGLAWTAAAKPALTILQDLTQQTGGGPEFPPIVGQDGALYGTTYTSNNGGGIYSIGTDGTNFTVLYQFPGGAGGSGPFGGLVQGSDGLFYGTTLYAGTSGQGTVFQFDAATRVVTILHAFDFADGSTPYAGLTQDSDGNFYGTTSTGGANNLGTIYKISSGTHVFSKLADMSDETGATPYSPLLIGRDGLLYGTTTGVGTSANGTIFRISPQGGAVEVLYHFGGQDGANPFSGLAAGKGDVLYGTTDFGGLQNAGVVFAFTAKGHKLTVLHSFKKTDGADPQGGIALDRAGRLFGTTFTGGANGAGTIYRFDPVAMTFKVMENLSSSVAGAPNAGLTYAGGKMFFGGALSGGSGPAPAGAIIGFSD